MVEWAMKDGDLVPNGAGGFAQVRGEQAVLQRALFKLMVRRGSFPFLPELGSKLYTLCREKAGARQSLCAQYVAQALEGEDVTITEVTYTETAGQARVDVCLEWQGGSGTVTARLGGVTDEND
ncbi:MAG: hypothetical protein IJB75_02995 [Oscillospiraceae bacterium]|nr:hypothetical protein [Oscillospiraceae bacterium]